MTVLKKLIASVAFSAVVFCTETIDEDDSKHSSSVKDERENKDHLSDQNGETEKHQKSRDDKDDQPKRKQGNGNKKETREGQQGINNEQEERPGQKYLPALGIWINAAPTTRLVDNEIGKNKKNKKNKKKGKKNRKGKKIDDDDDNEQENFLSSFNLEGEMQFSGQLGMSGDIFGLVNGNQNNVMSKKDKKRLKKKNRNQNPDQESSVFVPYKEEEDHSTTKQEDDRKTNNNIDSNSDNDDNSDDNSTGGISKKGARRKKNSKRQEKLKANNKNSTSQKKNSSNKKSKNKNEKNLTGEGDSDSDLSVGEMFELLSTNDAKNQKLSKKEKRKARRANKNKNEGSSTTPADSEQQESSSVGNAASTNTNTNDEGSDSVTKDSEGVSGFFKVNFDFSDNIIAQGAFSTVYHGKNRTTGEDVAIKVEQHNIRKGKIGKGRDPTLESRVYKSFHPNPREHKRTLGAPAPKPANQMLHQVELLHKKGFIHRNLKPEDFLLGADPTPRKVGELPTGKIGIIQNIGIIMLNKPTHRTPVIFVTGVRVLRPALAIWRSATYSQIVDISEHYKQCNVRHKNKELGFDGAPFIVNDAMTPCQWQATWIVCPECNALKNANELYLIDFNLAKEFQFTAGKSSGAAGKKKIKPQQVSGRDNSVYLSGAAVPYASVNVHNDVEQGPRDDLESLGYIFIYLLRGSLPWQDLCPRDKKTLNKNQKIAIKTKKEEVALKELCQGLPEEIMAYMVYCRELKYEDTPSYEYLKGLITSMMEKANVDLSKEDTGLFVNKNGMRARDQRQLYDWTKNVLSDMILKDQ